MNTRKIGTFYEDAVCEYLEKKGIQIIERNFRCRFGEVDIIGEDGEALIFFEVKYRKSSQFGMPFDAVDKRKQKKISRCCEYYVMLHSCTQQIRYDVVSVCGTEIDWIQNAFDHCGADWR